MADAIARIRAFCASFATHDAREVGRFLGEDAIWENVPIGIVRGRAAIEEKLAAVFAKTTGMDWEILAIAMDSQGRVLTERVDRFTLGDRPIALRLMGVFELEDGAITLWRDYFDLASYRAQMGEKAW